MMLIHLPVFIYYLSKKTEYDVKTANTGVFPEVKYIFCMYSL